MFKWFKKSKPTGEQLLREHLARLDKRGERDSWISLAMLGGALLLICGCAVWRTRRDVGLS